jgi:hypothetical protein
LKGVLRACAEGASTTMGAIRKGVFMGAAVAAAGEQDFFFGAREQGEAMEKHLRSPESMRNTHTELEVFVEEQGREYQRRLLQAHFELRAARERPVQVRGADGVPRNKCRPSARPLMTVVGKVEVPRLAYQAAGVPGLHPMDAALNLPEEMYSHSVRRRVAEDVAARSFDEVVVELPQTSGAEVPKRQVEELAARAAQDFDAFYATREVIAEETDDLLVLSFDGKGVAMRHNDLRPATKKAAKAGRRKLATRLTKGEKRNRKRMAQVATIYTLSPQERTPVDILHDLRPIHDTAMPRPRPVNKRVWASLAQSPTEVINAAFDDAERRDPERKRRWVVLVDGNKDQLTLIQKIAKDRGICVTIVLDIIHVIEYLWKAAYAFHEDGTKEAERWVEQRLLALLQGRSAGEIAKDIRRYAARRRISVSACKPVKTCARYLVKHGQFLHYDRALAEGLPIATGVIEGACRYLVKDRMDRTGARWSLQGAEAVLRLRSLRASGDFDAYWTFHLEQEHSRNHRPSYADGRIPFPLLPARPALRRVK